MNRAIKKLPVFAIVTIFSCTPAETEKSKVKKSIGVTQSCETLDPIVFDTEFLTNYKITSSRVTLTGSCHGGVPVNVDVSGDATVVSSSCSEGGAFEAVLDISGSTGTRGVSVEHLCKGTPETFGTDLELVGDIIPVGSSRSYTSIQSAYTAASAGSVLVLDDGTYVEAGQLAITKDIYIEKSPEAEEVIVSTDRNWSGSASAGSWWRVTNDATLVLRDLKLSNSYPTRKIAFCLSTFVGNIELEGVELSGCRQDSFAGRAIFVDGGQLKVKDSVISNFGRVAIDVNDDYNVNQNPTGEIVSFVDVTRTQFIGLGTSTADYLNYGIFMYGGDIKITESLFSGFGDATHGEASSDGTDSMAVANYPYGHTKFEMTYSVVENSRTIPFTFYRGSNLDLELKLNYNHIGRALGAFIGYGAFLGTLGTGGTLSTDLRYNWWGHADGPDVSGSWSQTVGHQVSSSLYTSISDWLSQGDADPSKLGFQVSAD